MRIAGFTHVGHTRGRNEDSLGWDSALAIAVLADGMGGHPAGDVASRLAVDTTMETARRETPQGQRWLGAGGEPAAAIRVAHEGLRAHGREHPTTNGMGTTLVVVALDPPRARLAHVGDSRVYRFRAGALERLTRDDNAAQEAVDRGWMTIEAARHSVARHQLTQIVGFGNMPEPQALELDGEPTDRLLLCTDGLTGELADAEIEAILAEHSDDPDTAARALVTAALDRGGHDNVSVIVVDLL